MKPQSDKRNADPDYLRSLVKRAGISQRAAARAIGISPRSMRHYLSGERTAPYTVQFALESLAQNNSDRIPMISDDPDAKAEIQDGHVVFYDTKDKP